jgi:hypothetical protein
MLLQAFTWGRHRVDIASLLSVFILVNSVVVLHGQGTGFFCLLCQGVGCGQSLEVRLCSREGSLVGAATTSTSLTLLFAKIAFAGSSGSHLRSYVLSAVRPPQNLQ